MQVCQAFFVSQTFSFCITVWYIYGKYKTLQEYIT